MTGKVRVQFGDRDVPDRDDPGRQASEQSRDYEGWEGSRRNSRPTVEALIG